MKLVIVSAFILLLFACDQLERKHSNNESHEEKCFLYPEIIDNLNLEDLYDSARWSVYTWHCDVPYLPKADTLRNETFGELELRFRNAFLKNDTVYIDFDFIDNKESVLAGSTRNTRELATGVMFDRTSKRKIAMFSHSGYSISLRGGNNRFENPVQPEVISYIKKYRGEMNNCFFELAKRKGVIK